MDPDDPSVQGTLSMDQLAEAMDEFLASGKGEDYKPSRSHEYRNKVLRVIQEAEGNEIDFVEEEPEKDNWDCESIISTFSLSLLLC